MRSKPKNATPTGRSPRRRWSQEALKTLVAGLLALSGLMFTLASTSSPQATATATAATAAATATATAIATTSETDKSQTSANSIPSGSETRPQVYVAVAQRQSGPAAATLPLGHINPFAWLQVVWPEEDEEAATPSRGQVARIHFKGENSRWRDTGKATQRPAIGRRTAAESSPPSRKLETNETESHSWPAALKINNWPVEAATATKNLDPPRILNQSPRRMTTTLISQSHRNQSSGDGDVPATNKNPGRNSMRITSKRQLGGTNQAPDNGATETGNESNNLAMSTLTKLDQLGEMINSPGMAGVSHTITMGDRPSPGTIRDQNIISNNIYGNHKTLKDELKCRVEKDLYLDFDEYQHYTCANCYNQVPPEYFRNKLAVVRQAGMPLHLRELNSKQPVWTNDTLKIRETFKVEEKFEKWQICCRQAVECCFENAKYLPRTRDQEDGSLIDDPKRQECPGTWDGLSCWPPSSAGQLAWRECPRVAYLLDFEPACRGYVTKQCFSNSSWFINRNGHEWSDYSTCSPEGLYKARMLHASVAYVCEALIVVPALLIIGKFPNRGGNKRLRIMKSLLFYILVNSLIQALQRGFLAAGYFAEYRGGPARAEHHHSLSSSSSKQQLQQSQLQQDTNLRLQQQQQQQQHAKQLTLISPNLISGGVLNEQQILRAAKSLELRAALEGSSGFDSYARSARSNRHADSPTKNSNLRMAEDDDLDDKEEEEEEAEEAEAALDQQGRDELGARIFLTAPAMRRDRQSTAPHRFDTSLHLEADESPPDGVSSSTAGPAWEDAINSQGLESIAWPSEERLANSLLATSMARPDLGQVSPTVNETTTGPSGDCDIQRAAAYDDSTKNMSAPHTSQPSGSMTRAPRCKRNSTTTTSTASTESQLRFQSQLARAKRKESAWKAFFCWFLQMAGRLVRLMSYAWMFTGGVYLCSALQFAPAEPPSRFIKVLFFLTNAFPNLIFFAYVLARTLNEPSPLNIIIKVPYYWMQGDQEQVEQLYATQKVCWFEESKSQRIEDIADLPNLILVGSNVVLFVITLIILCRINRPGSTRPDMSPCAYFKAAGTLLFLYGGHYFFLAYRPESESCSVDTFMFYAFICIDVFQGIAISIVFCYMTQEGKVVISKYWRNRYLIWLSCFGDKNKLADNGYHHTTAHDNRMNHSTRSNTSGCNGHHDNVTELVNINDGQAQGNF